MSIEKGPKPDEILDTSVSESEKKESIILSFDAIKDIVISQIGSKAEIKSLEIGQVAEGAQLSAEIDAGMLGGRISIEGLIVNIPDGIAVHDLKVNARGYVKSRIENSLSGFGQEIKRYFEKQYGKSVSNIQIVGSNLTIELDGISANDSSENRDKSKLEHILETIDKEKGWDRIGAIDTYAREFIKQKRFDDARKVASMIQNEDSRNKALANIDKIEKDPNLKF